MSTTLMEEKEAELLQAFNLYCIYNPKTGHFDKSNTSKVPTTLLRNVIRAVGMCPTEKELAELEESVGGDEFSLDQVREMVIGLMDKVDNVEDIIMAYKTMAEDDPDGFIHKDKLWQKMRRRLPNDAVTDKMIQEAKPDSRGMIDYRSFVKEQFAVRELSIKLPQMEKDPTVEDVKSLLFKMYGSENGKPYEYKYKSNKQLYDELSGHGEQTRKLLKFGNQQQKVVREAIAFETRENVVETKLNALRKEVSPFKAVILLRELNSFYTGHKYVNDLEDMELACTQKLSTIRDPKELEAARKQVAKVEEMKKKIIVNWKAYA